MGDPFTAAGLAQLPGMIGTGLGSGQLKCLLGAKWDSFQRSSPEDQMAMLGELAGSAAGDWATGAGALKGLRAYRRGRLSSTAADLSVADEGVMMGRNYPVQLHPDVPWYKYVKPRYTAMFVGEETLTEAGKAQSPLKRWGTLLHEADHGKFYEEHRYWTYMLQKGKPPLIDGKLRPDLQRWFPGSGYAKLLIEGRGYKAGWKSFWDCFNSFEDWDHKNLRKDIAATVIYGVGWGGAVSQW